MKIALANLALAGLVFSGCSQKNTAIYYWDGAYQEGVYQYLNNEANPQEQISQLETSIQNAYKNGKKVPPGLYAHLGLLYSDIGRIDIAKQNFGKEMQLYPEAKTFMEFLIFKNSANNSLVHENSTSNPLASHNAKKHSAKSHNKSASKGQK